MDAFWNYLFSDDAYCIWSRQASAQDGSIKWLVVLFPALFSGWKSKISLGWKNIDDRDNRLLIYIYYQAQVIVRAFKTETIFSQLLSVTVGIRLKVISKKRL